jgi:ankyrin repeat protein
VHPQYDLNFLRCAIRELLRPRKISQNESILQFLCLDSIFTAIELKEISFIRYFLEVLKIELNFLNSSGLLSPLHLAAERSNRMIIEALLNGGAAVNFPNKKGQTPIYFASTAEIVQLFVDKGAQCNCHDESGSTPLHSATSKGLLEVIQALAKNKADLDSRVRKGLSKFCCFFLFLICLFLLEFKI